MKVNKSNFNKYKVRYIEALSESSILQNLCEQVWIFGSVINDISLKKHSVYSDIDIAIFPKVKDLRSIEARNIHSEINAIFREFARETPSALALG